MEPEINRNPYRTKSAFAEDIKFIKNNFNVLSLQEFLEINDKSGKFPERSLLITLDDGLAIQYDHIYPILKSYNIPATFFINNAFIDNRDLHYERKKYLIIRRLIELQDISVEREISKVISQDYNDLPEFDLKSFIHRLGYKSKNTLDLVADELGISFANYLNQNRIYLSTQEINTMLRNNMTLGGHSIDHPDYTELSLEDQVNQTLSSVNDLVRRFQLDYKAFAFPYNDRALDIDLFKRIGDSINVTFGSSGLLKDEYKMHFQRGSIDNSTQSFTRAMAVLFSKYYGLKITGKHFIKRN
ncbi:MAG: polysaccharide deacetylase family protein [Bacteroidales bacterium]|nr:polysaccharide deacetylase family protein [Bacteroidales bacterium]